MSAPSTPITRYAIPLGIAWSSVLISAYVFSRVADSGKMDPTRGIVTFLGVPTLSFLGFALIRVARRRVASEAGRGEDLVIAWVMTFLLGMHCLVLGLALRMIDSIQHALPLAIGLLFVGLGPVLGTLEHGSAMGIRTKATLASEEAWQKTHRLLAVLFPLAGIVGFSGFWISGWEGMAISVVPPVLALVIVIGYAGTRKAIEQSPPESRPTDGDA